MCLWAWQHTVPLVCYCHRQQARFTELDLLMSACDAWTKRLQPATHFSVENGQGTTDIMGRPTSCSVQQHYIQICIISLHQLSSQQALVLLCFGPGSTLCHCHGQHIVPLVSAYTPTLGHTAMFSVFIQAWLLAINDAGCPTAPLPSLLPPDTLSSYSTTPCCTDRHRCTSCLYMTNQHALYPHC